MEVLPRRRPRETSASASYFIEFLTSTRIWSNASTRISPKRGNSRSKIRYNARVINRAKVIRYVQFLRSVVDMLNPARSAAANTITTRTTKMMVAGEFALQQRA